MPIIGAGGIQTAEYIETALERDYFDFAAVGRAILNDPAAFRQQMMEIELAT